MRAISFRILAFIIVCLLAVDPALAGSFASFQVDGPAAAATFTPTWQSAKIGGGGQMNGISTIQADGTMFASSNTYGAYYYRSSGTCASGWGSNYTAPCWEQLFTASNVSPALTSSVFVAGAFEVEACPSNTNVAYALWGQAAYVSVNVKSSSRTWTKLPTIVNNNNPNNTAPAGPGRYIACDPNYPNNVLISVQAGVYSVTNGESGGSATVNLLSGLGTVGAVPDAVNFDPNTTTSGGASQHYWVFVDGTGLYETVNGGSSYTTPSGGPTAMYHVFADKWSQLWVCTATDANAYIYKNGTGWTTRTGILSGSVSNLAVDPTSSSQATNRVVASEYNDQIVVSTNNEATWTSAGTYSETASSPQPTWLGNANLQGINSTDIEIDQSGNTLSAGGVAVWELPSPIVTNPAWQPNTVGIETLVSVSLVSAPGNYPLVDVWDRGIFTLTNPDQFPSTYWTGPLTSNSYGSLSPIEGGWGLDYASTATNTFVSWVISNDGAGTAPATSTDGGNTWTLFPTVPSAYTAYGTLAASTPTHWLLIPGINESLNYTINGGTSWVLPTLTGASNFYANEGVRFPLAADRVTANSYCVVDGTQNFYTSTASTPSFTKVATSANVDGGPYLDMLFAVPGNAGTFFYSANGSGSHMWKTTNSCATWTEVNSLVANTLAFGFGAGKPGASANYTIYAYAEYNGASVYKTYESDDGGSTWALINAPANAQQWPNNSLDFMRWMSGDANVYGRIYVGYQGSGYTYIDTQNACPWVDFSNIKPTQALTGTVNLTATQSGLVPVTSVAFYDGGTLIGTQTGAGPWTQSWNASATTGAHTLKVVGVGNGCTLTGGGNSFSIPVTTS